MTAIVTAEMRQAGAAIIRDWRGTDVEDLAVRVFTAMIGTAEQFTERTERPTLAERHAARQQLAGLIQQYMAGLDPRVRAISVVAVAAARSVEAFAALLIRDGIIPRAAWQEAEHESLEDEIAQWIARLDETAQTNNFSG